MAKRSPSWSAVHFGHARNQYSIDLPRDISPASALRISSANCHPSERDFADRVVHTSAALKSWCSELLDWRWHGIHAPSNSSDPASLLNNDAIGTQSGTTNVHVDQATAWGSLPEGTISVYKSRLQNIDEELQNLDIEELKHHVLLMHLQQQSPEPAHGSEDGRVLRGYQHLDTVTALISTTVLHSLPYYSRLNSLLATWSARIAICELIPLFFNELQAAHTAVSKAWQRLEAPNTGFNHSFPARLPHMQAEALQIEYESLKTDVSFKVSRLGRRVDKMLDLLEGSPDSLPDIWIDTVDGLEASYSSWIVEANSKILELNLGDDQSSGITQDMDLDHNSQKHVEVARDFLSVEAGDVAQPEPSESNTGRRGLRDDVGKKEASLVLDQIIPEPVQTSESSNGISLPQNQPKLELLEDASSIMPSTMALVANFSTPISTVEIPPVSETGREDERSEYEAPSPSTIYHSQTAQQSANTETDAVNTEYMHISETPYKKAVSNSHITQNPFTRNVSGDGSEISAAEKAVDKNSETKAQSIEKTASREIEPQRPIPVEISSTITRQHLQGHIDEVNPAPDAINENLRQQIPSIKLPDFSVPSTATHSRHASQNSRFTSHSRTSSNDLSRRHSEQSLVQASRLSPVSDYSTDPAASDPVIRSASITSMAYIPMSKIRRVSIFRSMSDPAVLQSIDDTSLDALDLSSPGPIVQAEQEGEERKFIRHSSPIAYRFDKEMMETVNSFESSQAPDSSPLPSAERIPEHDEEQDEVSDDEGGRSPYPNGRAWRGSLGKLDLDVPRDEASSEFRQGTESSSSSSLPTPVADEFSFLQTGENLHADRPSSPTASEFSEAGDRLDREIDRLITSIPARIRFKRRAPNKPTISARTPPRAYKNQPQPSPSIEADPSFDNESLSELTLAPAPKSSRPKRGSSDIKVYFLTPPGKSKPIKLYVRLVGENGERVMVRVGGGWADLGEYLREYAAHHGHVVTPEKAALLPGSLNNRKTRVVSAPGLPQRPKTPTSSRPGTTNGRRTVTFSQPDVPEVPKLPRPSSRMSNAGSRPASRISQSYLANEANPQTPPRNQDRPETPSLLGKRSELTPEKQAWLDDMVQRAKQWKKEKDGNKPLEGFEDLGKAGSTRRIARISDIGVTMPDDRE